MPERDLIDTGMQVHAEVPCELNGETLILHILKHKDTLCLSYDEFVEQCIRESFAGLKAQKLANKKQGVRRKFETVLKKVNADVNN